MLRSLLSVFIAALAGFAPRVAAAVDFNRDVRPILSEKCFSCHGPDEESRKAKLRLDVRDSALQDRDGFRAIVPGDPAASELIVRITSKDPDEVMPPPDEQHAITDTEVQTLREWIKQGAPYAPHWSFAKIERAAVPRIAECLTLIEDSKEKTALDFAAWEQNPIDGFIFQKLAGAGLLPSPQAEPEILIRRLSLDLIGLAPTPEESAAFVAEWRAASSISDQQATISKAADRLLASPHFGERWAKMWLDLARYADSTGYGSDALRLNIWPYRDWVINAFNRNMPYDQFTIEQLAGDLLPNATPEQIAATAFHRNTMTNTEGGTDDEEWRVAAVKDRVATTMQVWMGLTAQCAQCHSHKFDPISHREYYQLFAIFNQTEDADRNDEEPKLALPTPQEKMRIDQLKAEIAALEEKEKVFSADFEEELHAWEAAMTEPVAWQPLRPGTLETKNGAKLAVQEDAAISATGENPEQEKYTLRIPGPVENVTALRLEALTDEALPNRGPGRAPNGNAVVTDFRAEISPRAAAVPQGRFVRVTLPGDELWLMLAEVEVFSGGANVAPKGKASASSTDYGGEPKRANDGKTNGHFFEANSVFHSKKERDPWWEIDLGSSQPIEQIGIWARTDGHQGMLKNFRVELLDAERKVVWQQSVGAAPAPQVQLTPSGGKTIVFSAATADLNPDQFEPEKMLDADAEKTGWALSGGEGHPHTAIFNLKEPANVSAEQELVITVRQYWGQKHTLGRFRISATAHTGPVRELPASLRATLALEPSEREPAQREALITYFRPLSKTAAELNQQLIANQKELAEIKPVQLPIMRERTKDRRKTFVFNKGNYLAPAEPVEAALPVAFTAGAGNSGEAPEITGGTGNLRGEEQRQPISVGGAAQPLDRLALAQWIVSRDNPLTARVTVNRFWAQLFGTGLVESEEDFGTQGSLPSHPELLDWLATEFMNNGWDVKRLLKQIVTSQTYQQSSRVTPEILQRDPRNRLLARFPRQRLDAEGVRDQALQIAGLLSRKIGGPSVYPPQPDGLWRVAFNGGQNSYPTSKGEDLYRRGIYTFWRRTMPNPTMSTFDAPSRENCTLRRSPTNTPLQAFVTLNDPVFAEAAQALGRRILREGGANTDARLRFGLQLCLSRPVEESQLATLRGLYEETLATYRENPDAATKLATMPLGPLPEGMDAAEAAAWMVVANVLLNLDGVLTKS